MEKGVRKNRNMNGQKSQWEHTQSAVVVPIGGSRWKRKSFQNRAREAITGAHWIEEARRHSQHLDHYAETEEQNEGCASHAMRKRWATGEAEHAWSLSPPFGRHNIIRT